MMMSLVNGNNSHWRLQKNRNISWLNDNIVIVENVLILPAALAPLRMFRSGVTLLRNFLRIFQNKKKLDK